MFCVVCVDLVSALMDLKLYGSKCYCKSLDNFLGTTTLGTLSTNEITINVTSTFLSVFLQNGLMEH